MTTAASDGAPEDISLADAADDAMDAMFVVEIDGRITYANHVVEHLLGWEPAAILGTNLASHIHPDDLEPVLLAVARVDQEAPLARSTTHIRLRRRDGEFVPFSIGGNLIAGDAKRFFVVFRSTGDLETVFELITRLSENETNTLGDVLGILPGFIQWRHDAPRTCIVWLEGADRHLAGDDVPPELCGLAVDRGTESPWTRAWAGEECAGEVQDLPAALQPLAEAENLVSFWTRPVRGVDGGVEAVITMWDPPRDRPLSAYKLIFEYLTRAAQVAVLWHGQRRELVHRAAHDSLTGVANRRVFYEAVTRPSTPLDHPVDDGVLYIDLDGFKPVNDSHGHAAGDAVLAEVAERLQQAAGDGDLVARLGGDEFAILSFDTTLEDATELGHRVLELVQKPMDVDGTTVVIGASVGAAVGAATRRDELTKRADQALYRAKAAGGRVVVTLAL